MRGDAERRWMRVGGGAGREWGRRGGKGGGRGRRRGGDGVAARGGAALVVARLARVARVVAMGWEAHELGGSTARAAVAGNVAGMMQAGRGAWKESVGCGSARPRGIGGGEGGGDGVGGARVGREHGPGGGGGKRGGKGGDAAGGVGEGGGVAARGGAELAVARAAVAGREAAGARARGSRAASTLRSERGSGRRGYSDGGVRCVRVRVRGGCGRVVGETGGGVQVGPRRVRVEQVGRRREQVGQHGRRRREQCRSSWSRAAGRRQERLEQDRVRTVGCRRVVQGLWHEEGVDRRLSAAWREGSWRVVLEKLCVVAC